MAKNRVKFRTVIIGGSSGSIDVLLKTIPQLPKNYPLAVIIVVHRKETAENLFLSLMQLKSKIKVKEAEGHELIKSGCVYIAPADYHLLIESNKTFTLDFSEKVMYSRPSIDVAFSCGAEVYGNDLVGILVTGANEDGAIGLQKIQNAGGYTIIQDPKDANVPIMPESAEKLIVPDAICTSNNLIDILNEFAK